MDVDEIISKRKSIRSFQNTPVPDDVLESLVNVAHQAPSWMNKQCWHFIIITDKGTIEEIAQASIINRWLKQAPALIILCADPFLSGKRNDLSYYLVDAAIAFDHLILSATDKGLGTCWIGSFDEEKIKKILGIPPRIRVILFTPIGYHKEKESIGDKVRSSFIRSTKRKALSEILHWKHW
jgi:nitroreductase